MPLVINAEVGGHEFLIPQHSDIMEAIKAHELEDLVTIINDGIVTLIVRKVELMMEQNYPVADIQACINTIDIHRELRLKGVAETIEELSPMELTSIKPALMGVLDQKAKPPVQEELVEGDEE